MNPLTSIQSGLFAPYPFFATMFKDLVQLKRINLKIAG